MIQAERDVTAFGARTDISAPEALLELVQTKAAEVAYWDWQVNQLDDADRAGLMITKTEQGYGPQGPVDTKTKTASSHIYVQMLHEAQNQLATYAASATRVGVDEALIEVITMQASWLVPSLMAAIELAQESPDGDPEDIIRLVLNDPDATAR